MNKELEALDTIKRDHIILFPNRMNEDGSIYTEREFEDEFNIIETALITNKRKLDVISEILVDVSKGNYADLNDAINEIREVLEDE